MVQSPTIEDFFREHSSAVYAYCVSLCRDQTWAEDLMQDTFVKATRVLGSYRGGNPRSWLFAIARTTFIDDVRKRRPIPTADFKSSPVVDPDVAEMDVLERVVRRLPDRQRVALLLCDLGGMGPAEIGEEMGISSGAAKVLVHRARVKFRKAYEEESG